MNARRIKSGIAALLVVCSAAAMSGCGDEASSANSYAHVDVDSLTREEIGAIASADTRLPETLENTNIKWIANWDINPDETGKNKAVELVIFEEKYGGTVEYYKVDWNARWDSIANYINAGEGIDFFPAGDMDAFPKGVIRDIFVPVDDYVDFDSELYADVKDANDYFLWGGQHYVIVNAVTGDNCVVIYNRDTIDEAGLDDPADLFAKGEWTWDTFQDMLQEFVDLDNQQYGIDGWWFEAGLAATCGVPFIGLEDGKLVNNLKNAAIERMENFQYDLFETNCVAIGCGDYGWDAKDYYIGEGKTLFYPCGCWALYSSPDQWMTTFGENAFFVPMPKDPNADEYYIPCGMDAYLMLKGGQNPEGVAAYAACKRVAILNEDAQKIGTEQLYNDYGWSEEMVEMKKTLDEMANANPHFDFYNGVSSEVSTILDSSELGGVRAPSKGTPWSECVSAVYAQIDAYLADANG